MVRAMRQYGRWLRDNYADLEHKEVWQSFVVLSVILLAFAVYAFEIGGPAYDFVLQMANVVLICYLVWRVETLSDLNIQMPTDTAIAVDDAEDETVTTELAEDNGLSPTVNYNIGMLLKQYCLGSQAPTRSTASMSPTYRYVPRRPSRLRTPSRCPCSDSSLPIPPSSISTLSLASPLKHYKVLFFVPQLREL